MELPRYIKAFGISYAGTLPKIKKSDDPLQPVFEAMTNALEAIQMSANKGKGEIVVKINLLKSVFSSEEKYFDFDSIQIEDNGIGFNEQEFDRMENLNDTRKGFLNKGSGRVQFLHAFDKTEVMSVFEDPTSTTGYKGRVFFSKGFEISSRRLTWQILMSNGRQDHLFHSSPVARGSPDFVPLRRARRAAWLVRHAWRERVIPAGPLLGTNTNSTVFVPFYCVMIRGLE